MRSRQVVLRERQTPDLVRVEEEPLFSAGGATGYMPVSRDIDPGQRELIIYDLKRVDRAETVFSIAMFGFAAMVVCLCFILLIGGLSLFGVI